MTYLRYDDSPALETPAFVDGFFEPSSGGETVTGTSQPSGLAGSGPGDLLIGLNGSDTFFLQASPISISEVAGGSAKIVAWSNTNLANYDNIANLEIGGDRTYAAGDEHDNLIVATGSSQQLYGGVGQDVLVGDGQSDTFVIVKGEGNDAVYAFNAARDVLRLEGAGYTSFSQVQSQLSQVGTDVVVGLGGADAVVLRNLTAGELTAANFQLQMDPSKLGGLTFHDEFSGPLSLWNETYAPAGVWRPDYGYSGSQGLDSYTLTGNGEKEIYTSPYFRDHAGDFGEVPFVSNGDGTLSLVARPSENSEIFGYHYTSGMLTTKESFAQIFGYFEMRADLPANAGGWPAFWLLPTAGWPPELDAMETLTRDPNAAFTSVHSNVAGAHTVNNAMAFVPETSDGFHTYGVLWTRTDLTWYIDGAEVFHAQTPPDLNTPMYLIANLALGGWGGDVDAGALPAEMKIDYIRAYGLADGSSTVVLPHAPPTPPDAPSGLADAAIVGGYVNLARDTATQTLAGTAAPGTTVTVFDGTTVLGSVDSDPSSGAWSWTLGKLADGTHSLTATAKDAAGLVSEPSAPLVFTVDTQPPGAPSGLADSAVVGGKETAASNVASQTLTGIAEAASTVTVFDGAAAVGSTVAGGDGAWSFTLGKLAAGDHSLSATATDLAGNSSPASALLTFTVESPPPADTVAPVTSIAAISYASAGQTATVSGLSEAGAAVKLFQDGVIAGTATASASGAWSVAVSGVTSGTHAFTASGADLAGNIGAASNPALFDRVTAVRITGTAADETLIGLAKDTLAGGGGDDTYVVGATSEVISESAGGGSDTVQSSVTWTLGAQLETLKLTGAGAISGTGNELANMILGNAAANRLTGGGGADTLDGGAGADTLRGGAGDDVYIVRSATENLSESSGEGYDTVYADVSWTQKTNIERLVLSGPSAIDAKGSTGGDLIEGNAASNKIDGAMGNDSLFGGGGADTLTGGQGADRFAYADAADSSAAAPDVILDFKLADKDVLDLSRVDADTTVAGDQAFVWATSFTGAARQMVATYNASANQTTLRMDTDGDGAGDDMTIVLSGSVNATFGFVL